MLEHTSAGSNPPSRPRILNFGSLNMDYVYSVEHIVQPGETISALNRAVFCGGKGLNQSVAAARAGAPVFHAGKIGTGGDALLRECEKYGIDTSCVQISQEETGHTFIQVDKNGQNSIVLFGGSNRTIERSHIDRVLANFSSGDFLILQNEINSLAYIMEQAARRGMRIILNPSPCDQAVLGCDLSLVAWLVLNEVEGEQITGEREPDAVLRSLAERYPKTGFVLTLGDKGAYCLSGTERVFQPSFPVRPVDTTAAGDTFLGYFAAGLVEGLPLPRVMEQAAAAAAIAVTRAGAAPSIPDYHEVAKFITDQNI